MTATIRLPCKKSEQDFCRAKVHSTSHEWLPALARPFQTRCDNMSNPRFNMASVAKKSLVRMVKDAVALGHNKGLEVKKCVFQVGWSIKLPNGETHHATSDSGMVQFVTSY